MRRNDGGALERKYTALVALGGIRFCKYTAENGEGSMQNILSNFLVRLLFSAGEERNGKANSSAPLCLILSPTAWAVLMHRMNKRTGYVGAWGMKSEESQTAKIRKLVSKRVDPNEVDLKGSQC